MDFDTFTQTAPPHIDHPTAESTHEMRARHNDFPAEVRYLFMLEVGAIVVIYEWSQSSVDDRYRVRINTSTRLHPSLKGRLGDETVTDGFRQDRDEVTAVVETTLEYVRHCIDSHPSEVLDQEITVTGRHQ